MNIKTIFIDIKFLTVMYSQLYILVDFILYVFCCKNIDIFTELTNCLINILYCYRRKRNPTSRVFLV